MNYLPSPINSSNESDYARYSRKIAMIGKLSQPKGCSLTSKAKTSVIDKELRETKKRQLDFDFKIQRELGKLNFPLDKHIKQRNKLSTERRSKRVNTIAVSPRDRSVNRRRVQTVPLSSYDDRIKSISCTTPIEHQIFTRKNATPIEVLPPLIKSIPIHLDPNMKFHKKFSTVVVETGDNSRIIKMLDSVIEKCSGYKKNSCSRSIDSDIKSCVQESSIFFSFVERIVDSVKFGSGNETLDNAAISHQDDQKLYKKLTLHSNEYKEELNISAMKFMKNSTMKKSPRKSSC